MCVESNIPQCVKAFNLENTTHFGIDNLSSSQRQLLRWHHVLGHMGFKEIQALDRNGLLPKDIANLRLLLAFLVNSASNLIHLHQQMVVVIHPKIETINSDYSTYSDQLSSPQPGVVP